MSPRIGEAFGFSVFISPLLLQHLLILINRVVVFGGADDMWARVCN